MHGGGDETRDAQAFRTLSSLVHESDSDSRDSFWLSSSRMLLPTTIPFYLLQCLSGLGQGKPPGARGRGQQTVVLP